MMKPNDCGINRSSRDFARVLQYEDYRNCEQVIARARAACFNSGQRIDDHFGDITEMVGHSYQWCNAVAVPAMSVISTI